MNGKIFTIKLLAFITALIILSFAVIMPQYSTGYNASLSDKINRLRSIEEPKIILVGDSNIAFGMNSRMIEDAFDMPVVNIGLHGGLNQAFHTDMIKPYIREGDIIIILPAEYNNGTEIRNPALAWTAIENDFSLWKGIAPANYRDLYQAFPGYFRRAINLWASGNGNLPNSGVYSRSAFNMHGDNVYLRPESLLTEEQVSEFTYILTLSDEMMNYWNAYNDYVISKEARLYMSCAPIICEAIADVDEFNAFQRHLEKNLNFLVISNLCDYMFPMSYFYDTQYHLNDTGVVVRTEQLIVDLVVAFDESSGFLPALS